jgi:putative addiction module component (TIGR02574 family)
MKKATSFNPMKLNLSEKILLVEDLWDSIAAMPNSMHVTSSQKEELDRRLKSFRKNPSSGSQWPEVKKRILKRG